MKRYEFTIDLDPSEHTHQAGTHFKVVGKRAMSYKDMELKRVEKLLNIYMARNKPEEKLDGALGVTISFFKHQETMNGKKLKQNVWKTTKPDCENWSKTAIDVLKKYFMHDDNQICDLHITKKATPGDGYIKIVVRELEE